MQITLQGKRPRTGLAHRWIAELPSPRGHAEAWWAMSRAMLNSAYLRVRGVASLVHPGAKMADAEVRLLTLLTSSTVLIMLTL